MRSRNIIVALCTYHILTNKTTTVPQYCDVIMRAVASQITSLTIVYSTVYSDAYQRIHQSSTSLAFVRGIHRLPVNSPHNWPVTRKMVPFDDVVMTAASPWLFRFTYIFWVILAFVFIGKICGNIRGFHGLNANAMQWLNEMVFADSTTQASGTAWECLEFKYHLDYNSFIFLWW